MDDARKTNELLLKDGLLATISRGLSDLGIGVDIIDENLTIREQSDLLAERFGRRLGEPCHEVYLGRDVPCVNCPALRALKSGATETLEIEGSDGRRYNVVSIPLPRRPGELGQLMEIIVDITSRQATDKALQKSEQLVRTVLEAIPEGVVVANLDGAIEYASPSVGRLGGFDLSEIVGRSSFEFFAPEDRERAGQDILIALDQGQLLDREFELLRVDGSRYPASVSAAAIRDDEGNPTGLVAVIRDVTERKAADAALRAEWKRAQDYLDIAGVMLVALDSGGKVSLVNRKGAEVLGGEADDIIGLDWFDSFVLEGEREAVREVFDKLMRGEVEPVEHYRNSIRDLGGSPRSISWHNTVIRDRDGRIAGTLSSGEDVTERERAEQALRRSEQMFRNIAEHSTDVIFTTDGEGRLTYLSPAIARVAGFEPEELLGQRVYELAPADRRDEAFAVFEPLLRGVGVEGEEAPSLRKNGTLSYVEISASPVIADGEVIGVQGIARDVTERKRSADQLRELASRLALAEEAERRRIATELHDQVGQTLALASLRLGALREEAESQQLKERLDEVRHLWQDAITYTRSLTADLSPPVLYELGFEAAVEWLVERQQALHDDLELRFVNDPTSKPLSEELRVVLFLAVRELLTNVIKHSQADGAKVELGRSGQEIEILVEDDGAGFDPRTRGSGAEFGLFSIRERLGPLGGRLEVESSPGHGTRVRIRAPLLT